MPDKATSESVENFVKTVYVLQQKGERVSTNALRLALEISAPSVTDMAQRLVEANLIDYKKYRGVRLTEDGEALALKLIRRHRLIELYLLEELGYELKEVHDEAEKLEHAVSDRFIAAIASKLDHPDYDPHGDPIPNADGLIKRRDLQALSDIDLNTPGHVSRLLSDDTDLLQHTLDRGFTLNARVEVLARDPFDGPITVRLNEVETVIGHAVAKAILVEVM